ncbi:unnamed protein product [Rotaria sordida]|uniref:Aldehyde dehydrogenase domain-containing protein n=1 Tax=Rotaria sordida TaxID=392033 RepID=A0A814X5Z5_9BILA|nr:unnamed protein product [Rotaria sordida]CAF1211425.1 unnamed protein product [Rotaria sordida]
MLIVLKPTEQTPLSALYCAALIKETGFPPDVVNIILEYLCDGPECGYVIAVHAHIDKVACTNSVEIGKKIQESLTKSNLKCVTFEVESDYKFGDKLECGGERVDNKDYFIKATIFSDVKDDMQITREEIFGPVMSVLKYDSYEEVTKRANGTTFELGAGVITGDIRCGLTLAHQIRPGSIWINTYKAICNQALFGGLKQSGQERKLGRYGLEAYYQVKIIVVKLVRGKTIQIFHEEQLFGFACLTF